MLDPELSSFQRAKEYIKKAEEYYEMCFEEFDKNKWTSSEKLEFVELLMDMLKRERMIWTMRDLK